MEMFIHSPLLFAAAGMRSCTCSPEAVFSVRS